MSLSDAGFLEWIGLSSKCVQLSKAWGHRSEGKRSNESTFDSEIADLVELESDQNGRIFRVQKDPFRAISCTLKLGCVF